MINQREKETNSKLPVIAPKNWLFEKKNSAVTKSQLKIWFDSKQVKKNPISAPG